MVFGARTQPFPARYYVERGREKKGRGAKSGKVGWLVKMEDWETEKEVFGRTACAFAFALCRLREGENNGGLGVRKLQGGSSRYCSRGGGMPTNFVLLPTTTELLLEGDQLREKRCVILWVSKGAFKTITLFLLLVPIISLPLFYKHNVLFL